MQTDSEAAARSEVKLQGVGRPKFLMGDVDAERIITIVSVG